MQREVEYLQKLGVELKCDFVVGKTRTIGQLMTEDGYDAVSIGVGAGLPWFMDVPGENLNGVYSANEFLTRNNLMKAFEFPNADTPIKRHKNVAVVGGGNVAMDSASRTPRGAAATRGTLQQRTVVRRVRQCREASLSARRRQRTAIGGT